MGGKKKSETVTSFNERFSIKLDSRESRSRFVNRVINLLEQYLPQLQIYYAIRNREWNGILQLLAIEVGKRYDEVYTFQNYADNEFTQTCYCLESLYGVLKCSRPELEELVELVIREALSKSEVDLGIAWRDGHFWPSGAKSLDESLVNDNLKWLADKAFDGVRIPFEKGLRHYLEAKAKPERLIDTVTDVYEALEAMAKVVTENDRDLSANAQLFVSKLKLSKQWANMLREYIDFGCEFRHAVEARAKRQVPSASEVEAFIYATGLFIRLATQKLAG